MSPKKFFHQILELIKKYSQTDIEYVIKGSFWWFFGRSVALLGSFLILFTFAHFATKEVYGTYQYVISMAALIGIFSLPGLNTALVRAVAKGKERTFFACEKEKIKFGAITFLVSLGVALWYFFHQNIGLALPFLIVAIFLPFQAIFNLYPAFWQGKKKFDIQNKYFAFHNLLAAILISLIVFLKPETIYVVFGYFFAFALTSFIFYRKTKKQVKKDTEIDKETPSFGKHLTIMYLPQYVATQIDKVILWQFLGPIAVAIYVYALRLVERAKELIPFSFLALPRMSEIDLKKRKRQILKKFFMLFLVSASLTLLYILVCPLIFKFVFPNYSSSIPYSQAFSLILLLSPFLFLETGLVAQMKKRELYALNFLPQVLKIILFFVLVPLFNLWGAVLAILISQTIYSALTLFYFLKI